MIPQTSKPTWIIAGAVDSELRGIRARLSPGKPGKMKQGEAWVGSWKGEPIRLLRTGVGPRKAARALESALARGGRSRGVLSIGYAGALRAEYRVGDLVIPGEVRSIAPLPQESFLPDSALFQRVCDAARSSRRAFHTHRMLTSDRVIADSAEKRRLGLTHEAGSVEMESAAVAGVAARLSIPFLAVRVVSDSVTFTLPNLSFLEALRQRKYGRLARHLVFRPVETVRILQLGRHTRTAAGSLTEFLCAGVLEALAG